MQPLSQRDNRWNNTPLGSSKTTTIGSHGCTITCLTMVLNYYGYNETPATVNTKLKNNGGFAYTNLLVWTAIPKIWDRMKFEWRGYGYDNNLVSSNLPCLVEVDMDNTLSTPKDKHWVVFKGNQKMNDPWYGTERATNAYKYLTGYAVITGIQGEEDNNNTGETNMEMYKGIDLDNKASVKVAVDLWADVVQNGKQVLTKSEVEKLGSNEAEVISLKSKVKSLEEENSKAEDECQSKLSAKETQIRDDLGKTIQTLQSEINKLNKELEEALNMQIPNEDELIRITEKLENLSIDLTKARGQLEIVKRVGYQSFYIPIEAWDKEETILTQLTSLTSSGNSANMSTSKLFSVLLGRLGKLVPIIAKKVDELTKD